MLETLSTNKDIMSHVGGFFFVWKIPRCIWKMATR